MKVIIAGATGFIGRQLLLLLGEKGCEITALTRDTEISCVQLPVLCHQVKWNPDYECPSSDLVEGTDAVINLAGENIVSGLWTSSRKGKILRSRINAVRRLTETLEKTRSKPSIFISASAIGIYGDRGDEPLSEDSPPGDGFLAEVCQKWEEEVSRVRDLGIRAISLRFGMVLGHDGGAMNMRLPPFRMGLGGPVGDGTQWMSWIHAEDAARLIFHAMETPSMEGAVNAVSPKPAINKEFSKALGVVLSRPAFLPAPSPVLKAILGDLSQLLLFSQNVSAEKSRHHGFQFIYPDLLSALKEICGRENHELLMEQWVPQRLDRIFEFFSDANNLETITLPILNFKILNVSTDTMMDGTKLDYRMKVHGIPVHWQSIIRGWVPGVEFSDEQSRGPYAFWYHTHQFFEKDGGTVIRDCALYRLPFGVPGDVIVHWLVRRDLESIFRFRRKKIEELFGKDNRLSFGE